MSYNIKWVRICFLFIAVLFLNTLVANAIDDNPPRITVQELKAKIDKGENVLIIDVRTGQEYESSKYKIKGALRIPIVSLESRIQELPKDREIIFYCT